MRQKSKRESLLEYKAKKLARLLKELKNEVIVVEGKRDRQALQQFVDAKIVLITGKTDDVASRLESQGVERAAVLTDFDRRGEELAQKMKEALESHSITPSMEARRTIKFVLGLRFFEEFNLRMEKFVEECEANGVKIEV